MGSSLRDLVEEELIQPVDPRVTAMAEAIAARHGKASRAVLFYGSCLRQKQLDGLMLDFYLIVSDYDSAYDKGWLAKANALIPPNVFPFEHGGLLAKYAVLSEDHFLSECALSARDSSTFARFAQPSRLVWSADEDAGRTVGHAIATAAPTLLQLTRTTMTDLDARDVLEIWKRGFRFTYGSELRAERSSRPDAIVDVDPERYRRFAQAAGFPEDRSYTAAQNREAVDSWKSYQRRGKRAQILRLAKASLTYAGGAEYIAWKINRHAGTSIELKPWQKRHPLLAAISLLPRLLRSGAIR